MLWFPEHFFQSEYREGFLVESTMKAVWAAELEVLAMVAQVCAKYQLKWFADWGTLLGAVRHQGFVPWDDDIDICMLRSDFDRLMEILPNELPNDWNVKYGRVNEQGEFWASVTNGDTISIDENRLRLFHGCPFYVGIDIFPLDFLPNDQSEIVLEEKLYSLISKLVFNYKQENKSKKDENDLQNGLTFLEKYTGESIKFDGDLVSRLWSLANQICSYFSKRGNSELVLFPTYVRNHSNKYNRKWFDEVTYLPFETVEMTVPKNYHEILSMEYGDYSVPLRGESSHEYPFYNRQLVQLRKIVKNMEE